MTLKIAICDDCEKDRKHMIQLLMRYAFAHECDFHIEEFQNGKELQKKYCTRDTFQIIFIDIEMPDESGIDVADRIKRNVDHDAKVVFVSNYPEYMQDSFKVHPYHFLQKQVTDVEIQKLMYDVLFSAYSVHLVRHFFLRTQLFRRIRSRHRSNGKNGVLILPQETFPLGEPTTLCSP